MSGFNLPNGGIPVGVSNKNKNKIAPSFSQPKKLRFAAKGVLASAIPFGVFVCICVDCLLIDCLVVKNVFVCFE